MGKLKNWKEREREKLVWGVCKTTKTKKNRYKLKGKMLLKKKAIGMKRKGKDKKEIENW